MAGAWAEDVRAGVGKYTYANGDAFEGRWAGNVREGDGVYTYAATGSQVFYHCKDSSVIFLYL